MCAKTLQKEFDDSDRAAIEAAYQDMLASAAGVQSEEDRELVDRAFRVANRMHDGVRRKDGTPYILHPIAVAKLVSKILPGDAESLVCALLHDVVEDTDYTLDQIKQEFNPRIAVIVDGLTKIDRIAESCDTKQTLNFQKLINTIEDDFRIILIKLADRLHNMQTLSSMSESNQKKIASETTYFYAPIAERVGLYDFKVQLEDLAFKYRDPEGYAEIERKLQLSKEQFINRINNFSLPISAKLKKSGMEFSVSSRTKSIYSIWRKMQRKNISFDEIYDLLAMRIVFKPKEGVPEKTQCWFIYTLITDIYSVLRDRTRDWVSTPKVNGYEALQCTLLSKSGNWVEVQIRTERMNAIAENGLAAHWRYKGDNYAESYAKLFELLRAQVTRVRSVPYEGSMDFVSNVHTVLFGGNIHVYDAHRKRYELSRQATVLDFAYEQSRYTASRALAARVDGALRGLNSTLRGGEVVEIIAVRSMMVSSKWLDFVRTQLARSCIKQQLDEQHRLLAETGKQWVANKCGKKGAPVDEEQLKAVLPHFEVKDLEELYADVASGNISMRLLKGSLRANGLREALRNSAISRLHWFGVGNKKSEVVTAEALAVEVQQSPCCNALPGDDVCMFERDDHTVVAHRTQCQEGVRLAAQQANRMRQVAWRPSSEQRYSAPIYLSGRDEKGLLENLFRSIATNITVDVHKVDMQSDGYSFRGVISVHVRDVAELRVVMQAMSSVPGVLKVMRVLSQPA